MGHSCESVVSVIIYALSAQFFTLGQLIGGSLSNPESICIPASLLPSVSARNVCHRSGQRLQPHSNFCGRPLVEVTSLDDKDVALIAFDEWHSQCWMPVLGDGT